MKPTTKRNTTTPRTRKNTKSDVGPKATVAPKANHPQVDVSYRSVPPEFKPLKRKYKHPAPRSKALTEEQKLKVLSYIKTIKTNL